MQYAHLGGIPSKRQRNEDQRPQQDHIEGRSYAKRRAAVDASPSPMLAAKDATMFSFGILKRVLVENSSAEITTPSAGGSETSISDGYADSDSEDPIDEAWTA